jgi:pilus assembly protein TadC
MKPRRLAIVVLLLALVAAGSTAHPAMAGPIVAERSPEPGTTIYNNTPTISARFVENGSAVDAALVVVKVNNIDVTELAETTITESGFTYEVPQVLRLREGNVTVVVEVSDTGGGRTVDRWNFSYNSTPPSTPADAIGDLIFPVVVLGALLGGGGGAAYYIRLRRSTGFTFRRYFKLHPVNSRFLTIYVPPAVALLVFLVGIVVLTSTTEEPEFSFDMLLISCLLIGITGFAIDGRRELRLLTTYERAFSQLLFELADAMRGGIDPAKAIIELSDTHTGPLSKPLRVAADNLQLGRPFEEVLISMVAPMRSALITRYAALVGEASKFGGQVSLVVLRAAKDMDELLKIEGERRRQMGTPVITIYIAFGVLMAVIYSLITLAPQLGEIDVGIFSQGLSGSSGARQAPKMTLVAIKSRFLHLLVVNSLGTGALIGAFTNGRLKYGLTHGIVMTTAALVFFWFMIR